MPESLPRPLLGADSPLDVRLWRSVQGISPFPEVPRLLVAVSRKMGNASHRNRFKRRVRMAVLEVLRERGTASVQRLVLFVRPSRAVPKGQDIPFEAMLRTLRLALSRI